METWETSPETIINFNTNDNPLTDNNDIANAFNNFFSTIASNIQNKIPNIGNFVSYIKRPNPSSFFFKPVTQDEMPETFNLLNQSKSTSDCSIPRQIFECVPQSLSFILTSIINLTFETGIFHNSLKTVKIIPIF